MGTFSSSSLPGPLNWSRKFSYTVSRWCGKSSVPLWRKMCDIPARTAAVLQIPDLGFLLSDCGSHPISSYFLSQRKHQWSPLRPFIWSYKMMEFLCACLNVWESQSSAWRHIKIKSLLQLLVLSLSHDFPLRLIHSNLTYLGLLEQLYVGTKWMMD